MADILNDYAVTLLAQEILGWSPAEPAPVLHLFTNNFALDHTTLPSQLVECSAPGYNPIQLIPTNWTIPAPAGGVVSCTYPPVAFNFTASGNQTIYGHYVLDSYAQKILWGATWPSPFVIPADGGIVQISPYYTSKQCTS